MKTLEQLERHKLKVDSCQHKFILCNQEVKLDLFGAQKKNLITPLPISCHSYYCKKCGYIKKMDFRRRVKQNLKNDTWYFVTLTTAKNNFNTTEALSQINKSWNAFLSTVKIKYPNVRFIKVLEISKRESVHLHIIWNINVPRKRVKKLWERYHKSYICDVSERPIANTDIANYLSKYVDKDMCETNSNDWYYLHQKRRFSFSRNMERVTKEKRFTLIEGLNIQAEQLLKLIVDNLSCDDWNLQDLCLDYIPPGDRQLILDTFSSLR